MTTKALSTSLQKPLVSLLRTKYHKLLHYIDKHHPSDKRQKFGKLSSSAPSESLFVKSKWSLGPLLSTSNSSDPPWMFWCLQRFTAIFVFPPSQMKESGMAANTTILYTNNDTTNVSIKSTSQMRETFLCIQDLKIPLAMSVPGS